VTRAGKEAAPSRIATQPWMREPATRAVLAALNEAGIAARFVGGCVRDALLKRPIADIDLATPARPEEVMAALEKAGIKEIALLPPADYQRKIFRGIAEMIFPAFR